jgi:hypothetical protein
LEVEPVAQYALEKFTHCFDGENIVALLKLGKVVHNHNSITGEIFI